MKNGKKIWYYAKHLILFVGLAVCGCGSVHSAMFNKEHFCEYGEWQIIEEPLCEEDGVKARYCALDSSHAQKEIVPATGHTCEDFFCKDCGAEQVSVGLSYEETEKGLRIVGIGTCKDTELAIPKEIDGKQVVEIGVYAFSNNKEIRKVKIPDSVTWIASGAFYGCAIEKAVIPASACFYLPKENLKSVEITSGSIGAYAFEGCDNLTSVVIGDGVTAIGNYAFYYCSNLKRVEIGASIKTISSYAFYNCDSLTSVVIPNSVTSIGYQAFSDCTSLTSVVIGDSVTTIGNDAFYNCSNLTSVEIGDSVTSIGWNAFSNCTSLTSIVIPNSVTSIDHWAFYWCASLTSVYYKGTASEWSKISIGSSNSSLTSASRYYYSEAQATGFWHYNENGAIEIWK